MAERDQEQFTPIPDEEPKAPAPTDDDSMDVSGALAGLLDAVVPSANAEETREGAMTVSEFRETYDWSEFEFLPQNVSFGDYIFANAFEAWNEVNEELDEGDTIVPLELLLAIIKQESAKSVVVNSALDVDTEIRKIGFYARGDKFSLAAGASQMIPSTARSYGLRVMYTRDEVSITGQRPQPKDGYGKYSMNGRKLILAGAGWKEGDYIYPIVDQRTSVYHQMRATVRMLSESYRKARLQYSDPMHQMLEVASRYNSGRSRDNIPDTPPGTQQRNYINTIEAYLRQNTTEDIRIESGILPTQVTVNYDDAKVKPLSIRDIVTNEDLKLSLFRFLDENGDLRLNIPLKDIDGTSLKIPSGLTGKARRSFERVDAEGNKVWDVCTVQGNVLSVHAVENSDDTLEKRKDPEFTSSSEDEIDLWQRPDMWELTLQDVIDLGVRPSELLKLNPQLDLNPILAYRIPDGYEAVVPKDKKKAFEDLVARANAGISEIVVDASRRGRVVREAKSFITTFATSEIVRKGREIENPFAKINQDIIDVGMANSLIGETYAKLSDMSPGGKRWVDKIKKSKDLAPIFLEASLAYMSERAKGPAQFTYDDYVASLAILELSQSDYAPEGILSRHAEAFLFASTLTNSAAEVTDGIKEKRDKAKEEWSEGGKNLQSAITLSEISATAVQSIESLGEEDWQEADRYADERMKELLAKEGFTDARNKVKAYLSTWPKWDDFEFDFANATFGYEEARELAGVKIPLYKSTLLMIPFQYKPKDATAGETVAYVVFDMAEWKTAEDTWRAGMAEGISGEAPTPPEQPTETLEPLTGGSGEFLVIGVDGTIGELAELVMDGEEDMFTAGGTLYQSVWLFYMRKILDVKPDQEVTKSDVDAKGGYSMKYFEKEDLISIANSEGFEEYTIEGIDIFSLKIDMYHLDLETYNESKSSYSLKEILNKFQK